MPQIPRIPKKHGVSRGLSASLATVRAGGALAVDRALGKLAGRGESETDSAFARREAERFVLELGRLKGSYVKIGQMLALFGEQFLPPVLTRALFDLSDSTEALPWEVMQPAFEDALGSRLRELDIEHEAFAAASLAQVHRARVKTSGQTICLKIQYPGLADLIDADFDHLVRMLTLSRWVQAGRDLDDWLAGMRVQLHNEIDYLREADMTRRAGELATALNTAPVRYATAGLIDRYCTDTVLAMEYIEGHSVTDPEVAALPLARRNQLAQSMLSLFFHELYDWGMLQTDPNFGNYLIQLGDRRHEQAEDRLMLLDFGSVLCCEPTFLHHLRHLIAAGQQRDTEAVVDNLIGLHCLPVDASEEAGHMFADFCLHLLEPLQPPELLPRAYLNTRGEYCWARSRLMQRAAGKGARYSTTRHFTRPSRDFAFIARKLTGVFTFISVLEAEFNAFDLVQYHLDSWRQ